MNGYRDFNNSNSWAYPTEAERDAFQKYKDAQTPREGKPSGEPPFGLGQFLKNLTGDKNKDNVGCRYGQKPSTTGGKPSCYAEPICPAGQKGKKNGTAGQPPICVPANQSDNDDKDKPNKKPRPPGSVVGANGKVLNKGRLVSQVTPGKLKQNPNILATLLQQIIDFFKGKENVPTPIENVLKNYPQPPYSGTTVPPTVPSV